MAPSFITSMWCWSMAWMSPVTLIKMSPMAAASSIGMTRKPSITASSARSGSTSITITCPPMPRARIATPRPHQP